MAGLDGMRAIAAFMVVLYHFGVPMISGGEGVLMFFTLSGFLITWILLRENEETGTISLGRFYLRRSLRIFPAFYCYAAVLIGAIIVRHAKFQPDVAPALLYFNNYYQAIHGDPNTGFSHTWSLAVEEQFYLLWPLTFLLLRRNYRRLSQFLAGAILAIWVYREVLILVFGVRERYIYRAFDTRADHLLIGCLLAVMLRAGYFPRFWNWASVRPWFAVAVAGLLALSSVADSLLGRMYRDNVSFMVDPVLTAVWITQLIALRGTAPWSWMNWGWIRYLGRISYSIYLYQQLVMIAPRNWLSPLPAVIQLAALIVVILAMASASYFFVERPFLRMKNRYLQPGPANDPIRAVDDAAPSPRIDS